MNKIEFKNDETFLREYQEALVNSGISPCHVAEKAGVSFVDAYFYGRKKGPTTVSLTPLTPEIKAGLAAAVGIEIEG